MAAMHKNGIDGSPGINTWFLGVEMLMEGDWSYGPFRQALKDGTITYPLVELEATAWQVAQWCVEYGLTPGSVVRHSDVASDRLRGPSKGKLDPGAGLDWPAFLDLVVEWRKQLRLEVRNDG